MAAAKVYCKACTPVPPIKQCDDLWAVLIKRRDRICQYCKKAPAEHAHHIHSRRHKAVRWNLDNGVGLCYVCHFHRLPQDRVEFVEWERGHVGAAKYDSLRVRAHMRGYKPDYEAELFYLYLLIEENY